MPFGPFVALGCWGAFGGVDALESWGGGDGVADGRVVTAQREGRQRERVGSPAELRLVF